MDRKTPPSRIAEWRKRMGWSMEELAQKVGTTASTINKLEKGSIRITDVWMTRLAQAFGCRPVEVLFPAPETTTRVDAELLRRAYGVIYEIIGNEPGHVRLAVLPDILAMMYEILAEAREQGRELDNETLRSYVVAGRSLWRRFHP